MSAPRFAVSALFFAEGFLIGTWASRVPAVQQHAGVSTPLLGVALFCIAFGALIGMPIAGAACPRTGSRTVSVVGGCAMAATLVLGGFAVGAIWLDLALFAFGLGFGTMNVAINAQAIALERVARKPVLQSFHALYSVGGLSGAAGGAVAAHLAAKTHFSAAAAFVGLICLSAAPVLLPSHREASENVTSVARPRQTLVLLGFAAFCTLLGEGAAADWSAKYLRDGVGAAAGLAALGYSAYSLAMAVSRSFGDRLASGVSPVTVVRIGGLVGAAGIGLALATRIPALGLSGFALMGLGLGTVTPTLFRAAGTTPGVSAAAGVSTVATIGWLGFLTGPPLIGAIAGGVGLRAALLVVVGSLLLLAALARTVQTQQPDAMLEIGEVVPDPELRRGD